MNRVSDFIIILCIFYQSGKLIRLLYPFVSTGAHGKYCPNCLLSTRYLINISTGLYGFNLRNWTGNDTISFAWGGGAVPFPGALRMLFDLILRNPWQDGIRCIATGIYRKVNRIDRHPSPLSRFLPADIRFSAGTPLPMFMEQIHRYGCRRLPDARDSRNDRDGSTHIPEGRYFFTHRHSRDPIPWQSNRN